MKKKGIMKIRALSFFLVLIGLFVFSPLVFGQQWTNDTDHSGDIYIGGSVGIGTDTPSAKLDIVGEDGNKAVEIISTNGSTMWNTYLHSDGDSTGSNKIANIFFGKFFGDTNYGTGNNNLSTFNQQTTLGGTSGTGYNMTNANATLQTVTAAISGTGSDSHTITNITNYSAKMFWDNMAGNDLITATNVFQFHAFNAGGSGTPYNDSWASVMNMGAIKINDQTDEHNKATNIYGIYTEDFTETGAYPYYYDGNDGAVVIRDDSKVGIGTATPAYKLDIYEATGGSVSGLHLESNTQDSPSIIFDGNSVFTGSLRFDSDNDWFEFVSGGGFSIGSYGANIIWGGTQATGRISETSAGNMSIYGRESMTVATQNGSIILQNLTNNPALHFDGAANDGHISWDTTNSQFEITGGNVGIGTTNPATTLEVYGDLTAQTLSLGGAVPFINMGYSNSGLVEFFGNLSIQITGSQIMLFDTAGNVGIKNSSPSHDLDVTGQINGDELCISGVCQSSWPSSSIWTPNGSDISFQTGNVGIGTVTPAYKLDIAGRVRVSYTTPTIILRDEAHGMSESSYAAYVAFYDSADNQVGFVGDGGGGNTVTLNGEAGYDLALSAGGIRRLTIDNSSGNVGIGTTSPTDKVSIVTGAGNADGLGIYEVDGGASGGKLFLGMDGSGDGYLTLTHGNNNEQVQIHSNSITYFNGGNVGIGTSSPGKLLTIESGLSDGLKITSGGYLRAFLQNDGGDNGALQLADTTNFTKVVIQSSGNSFFNGGNVGIGMTNPSQKLTVAGNVVTGSFPSGTFRSLDRFLAINHDGLPGLVLQDTGTPNASIEIYNDAGTLKIYNQLLYMSSQQGDALVIDSSGNIGIGITSPTKKLDVNGDGHFSGDLTVDGNIGAKYQDLAEWVMTSEPLSPGTVVMIDTEKIDHVTSSDREYNTLVAGVVSPAPGIVLGEEAENKAMIAHTGRVKVKVDTSKGAISVGDLLVSSPVKGYAMKADSDKLKPGMLLGKALQPLEKGKKGEVLTLITLQ